MCIPNYKKQVQPEEAFTSMSNRIFEIAGEVDKFLINDFISMRVCAGDDTN